MVKNIELGKEGENFAKDYLENLDYVILEKNYRCRFGEIDLIAKQGNTVVFIEVKTRKSRLFGDPEESIDFFKIKKIKNTANYYITCNNLVDFDISFDVIALRMVSGKYILKHIKNAF